MSYLGLDLSLSSTGFFLLRSDGTNRNCEICTKPDDYPSLQKRAKAIAEKILEILKKEEEQIELALLEDYYVGQFAAPVISLAVLGTMVRDALLRNGFRYVTAKPSQVKKFESGSGASKKGNMVKNVFKNHSFDTASDNIADACALAYLCRGYAKYVRGTAEEGEFAKYQVEVLKSMKSPIELPYAGQRDNTVNKKSKE